MLVRSMPAPRIANTGLAMVVASNFTLDDALRRTIVRRSLRPLIGSGIDTCCRSRKRGALDRVPYHAFVPAAARIQRCQYSHSRAPAREPPQKIQGDRLLPGHM